MNPVPKLPTITAALIVAGSGALYAQSVDQPTTDDVYDLAAFTVTPLEEFANRAVYGETPSAFSELSKGDLDRYLASQEIPIALNYSPSVYATNQGGGAGDARVNVRGFDQKNVAVMINGVPVNDMENGWVYWSNWDGIGDVASSIQLQRGMSNLNLAVPSIGGTLNILTDPASKERGGLIKQEFGTDGFSKTTLVGHTGLINDKFAASGAIIRKQGGSYIDGVWTDAWAWYLGASYKINEKNTIELYGLGAPQRHGQNLYARNIGSYDANYALSLEGYDAAALETSYGYERGYAYNETWNYVDESYDGVQNYAGSNHPRRFSDYINERENYYDKPQVSVNWYFDPDSNWKWDNVFYYSGGEGGGSGTYGSVARGGSFGDYMYRNRDWNAQIATNSANIDSKGEAESKGILRNSVNEQWTIGAISKVTLESSENLSFSGGLDWRTASITHRYEVRDLLGGDYFLWKGSEKRLGDAFNYNNTNTVDWIGAFVQGAYEKDAFNGFAMAGVSQIKYGFEDHFRIEPDGSKYSINSDSIEGFQIKAGGRYDISETLSAYANLGYVEKVPIFDAVIDDGSGKLFLNPENEKFTNVEIGLNYTNEDGTFLFSGNIYRTNWKDRAFSKYVSVIEDYVNLTGVNQLHQGLEIEGSYYFNKSLKLDAAISLNDWTYTSDVNAVYDPEDSSLPSQTYRLFIDNLKVGDAPQTQISSSLTYMPTTELTITGRVRHNRDSYAKFDPIGRTIEADDTQSWKMPNHTVFDLHLNWNLPIDGDIQYELFANVLNVFDKKYIQDATDADSFSGYRGDFIASGDYADLHDADGAAVHFGAPRRINAGIKVAF